MRCRAPVSPGSCPHYYLDSSHFWAKLFWVQRPGCAKESGFSMWKFSQYVTSRVDLHFRPFSPVKFSIIAPFKNLKWLLLGGKRQFIMTSCHSKAPLFSLKATQVFSCLAGVAAAWLSFCCLRHHWAFSAKWCCLRDVGGGGGGGVRESETEREPRRILSIVNLVVNPECISKDPAAAGCTEERMSKSCNRWSHDAPTPLSLVLLQLYFPTHRASSSSTPRPTGQVYYKVSQICFLSKKQHLLIRDRLKNQSDSSESDAGPLENSHSSPALHGAYPGKRSTAAPKKFWIWIIPHNNSGRDLHSERNVNPGGVKRVVIRSQNILVRGGSDALILLNRVLRTVGLCILTITQNVAPAGAGFVHFSSSKVKILIYYMWFFCNLFSLKVQLMNCLRKPCFLFKVGVWWPSFKNNVANDYLVGAKPLMRNVD